MLNWRRGVLAILGVIFFLVIIAGLVLNTIFLVREIRRNEQHDSFINAVTHELKTPVASIRLYLQTLQTRELDEDKRREFYRIMLEDSDRLLHTIDQVLRAGSAGSRLRRSARLPRRPGRDHARVRGAGAHAVPSRAARRWPTTRSRAAADTVVVGDGDELQAAVWNLLDNAVKYSPADEVQDPGASSKRSTTERVAVRVTDHGVGISPAELKRIFRRFYRVPTGVAGPRQGQRPRPVHRPLGGARSTAAGPSPRARARATAAPSRSLLPRAAAGMSAAARPDRRRRAAPGRGAALQSRGGGLRASRCVETGEARARAAASIRRAALRPRRARRHAAGQGRLHGRVASCASARQFVPVLMLTARGRPEDVLNGFAAGADDYLPKPTELAILLARIGGLLARAGRAWLPAAAGRPSTRFAGKTIDFDTLELRVGDRTLPLTLMEANLLRYLIAHEGKAVSRKSMLEDVWGLHEDTDTRAIDNFIVRLRRYIEEDPGKPRHLLTVRGVGYRFVGETGVATAAPAGYSCGATNGERRRPRRRRRGPERMVRGVFLRRRRRHALGLEVAPVRDDVGTVAVDLEPGERFVERRSGGAGCAAPVPGRCRSSRRGCIVRMCCSRSTSRRGDRQHADLDPPLERIRGEARAGASPGRAAAAACRRGSRWSASPAPTGSARGSDRGAAIERHSASGATASSGVISFISFVARSCRIALLGVSRSQDLVVLLEQPGRRAARDLVAMDGRSRRGSADRW